MSSGGYRGLLYFGVNRRWGLAPALAEHEVLLGIRHLGVAV
jgi:hypothetical protein